MTGDGFATYVVDQLETLGPVTARAMFGGHGLYLGDTFFGIVFKDRLYLKVDQTTRDRYEEHGMGPFKPNERQTMRSYYEVPVEVLEDPDDLVAWASDAVEADPG